MQFASSSPLKGTDTKKNKSSLTGDFTRILTGFARVMENLQSHGIVIISFSRPGKSCNLGVVHGKSWKISMLSMNERK